MLLSAVRFCLPDHTIQTEFLQSEERLKDRSAAEGSTKPDAVGFNACSFSWDSFDQSKGSISRTRKSFRLRFDSEVLFHRGEVNLIVGPTASGKVRNFFFFPLSEVTKFPSDFRSNGSFGGDVLQGA